jgi:hypothetical protein
MSTNLQGAVETTYFSEFKIFGGVELKIYRLQYERRVYVTDCTCLGLALAEVTWDPVEHIVVDLLLGERASKIKKIAAQNTNSRWGKPQRLSLVHWGLLSRRVARIKIVTSGLSAPVVGPSGRF